MITPYETNKQINKQRLLNQSLAVIKARYNTNKHTNTQKYILIQMSQKNSGEIQGWLQTIKDKQSQTEMRNATQSVP